LLPLPEPGMEVKVCIFGVDVWRAAEGAGEGGCCLAVAAVEG